MKHEIELKPKQREHIMSLQRAQQSIQSQLNSYLTGLLSAHDLEGAVEIQDDKLIVDDGEEEITEET